MRVLKYTAAFSRDLKRLKRSTDKQTLADLDEAVKLLTSDTPLPAHLKDHPLKGDWKPSRDCHIKPDLVLIYTKTPGELQLRRLGSHAELFRK